MRTVGLFRPKIFTGDPVEHILSIDRFSGLAFVVSVEKNVNWSSYWLEFLLKIRIDVYYDAIGVPSRLDFKQFVIVHLKVGGQLINKNNEVAFVVESLCVSVLRHVQQKSHQLLAIISLQQRITVFLLSSRYVDIGGPHVDEPDVLTVAVPQMLANDLRSGLIPNKNMKVVGPFSSGP